MRHAFIEWSGHPPPLRSPRHPQPGVAVGQRVCVVNMSFHYRGSLHPDMEGTVTRVRNTGLPSWEVSVRWDAGYEAVLCTPFDQFEVIEEVGHGLRF